MPPAPAPARDSLSWLHQLHDLIAACLREDRCGVLACSALKESYRRILLEGNQDVQLVYLKGSYDLILQRMEARTGHYMQPGMLRSQFELLEEPQDALVVDVARDMDEIVEQILCAEHT